MNKGNFIKTSDEYTSKMLLSEGFTLIDCTNGIWTFMNDSIMTFDNNKKIIYSNMLTV